MMAHSLLNNEARCTLNYRDAGNLFSKVGRLHFLVGSIGNELVSGLAGCKTPDP